MATNQSTLKKNQPELLVDFNGNPVQKAWILGGKTNTITTGNSFICESTLVRICNSGNTLVRLKLKNADYSKLPKSNSTSDVGLPILPGTCEFFGVWAEGQEYEVTGGSVDITFCYDRRTIVGQ